MNPAEAMQESPQDQDQKIKNNLIRSVVQSFLEQEGSSDQKNIIGKVLSEKLSDTDTRSPLRLAFHAALSAAKIFQHVQEGEEDAIPLERGDGSHQGAEARITKVRFQDEALRVLEEYFTTLSLQTEIHDQIENEIEAS